MKKMSENSKSEIKKILEEKFTKAMAAKEPSYIKTDFPQYGGNEADKIQMQIGKNGWSSFNEFFKWIYGILQDQFDSKFDELGHDVENVDMIEAEIVNRVSHWEVAALNN
jgi:hypothetical protein